MNGRIDIDPEQVIARGNNIKAIYEEYVAHKNAILRTTEEVSTAWEGADSAGYVTAIHSYDEDFKQLGDVIAQMGDIIYRHGNRVASSRDEIRNLASRL